MAKYLVIVESPAKVQTIKKFLGSNYEVMASNGHVRDLPKSQMGIGPETDFEPKHAGEWFIEQIKTFNNYKNTKIVVISAAYNISAIAEHYGVAYIRKSTAADFPDAYDFLKS